MEKILIDALYPQEVRVVRLSKDNKILNFDYEFAAKKQLKGNIYLAKVTRVEPSLQAAFVEYGENKHGFLPFVEIHPDYYQIPAEDKKKIEKETFADEEKDGGDSNDRLNKIVAASDSNDCDEEKNHVFEKKKKKLVQKYKIQEVVKKNQLILVQVVKEERGNKGVSLSTYISLAGRYCVLMPNSGSKSGGISRRIENIGDRKRLRELIKSFSLPDGTSVILRTAVLERTDDEISKDYSYLVTLWNNIRQDTLSSSAPALVYQEADVIKRAVRDLYNKNVTEIIIEGGGGALSRTKKLMNAINPASVKKIREHKSKMALFNYYKVEKEINSFYSTIAQLESGGYLVINITEALISVDVNSGRATRERSVEETALKTNLEAAKEVARQLQLRDLSGLIVVDFIDMLEVENRKSLEKSLRKYFEGDKARVQIGRVSYFGLVELSRQRLKPSLIEANMVSCSNCSGTGYVKSYDAVSVDIFREVRNEILKKKIKVVKVFAAAECVSYIINYRRNNISSLEKENHIYLFFHVDHTLNDSEYRVESLKTLPAEEKEKLEYDKEHSISNIRLSGGARNGLKSGLVKKLFNKFAS